MDKTFSIARRDKHHATQLINSDSWDWLRKHILMEISRLREDLESGHINNMELYQNKVGMIHALKLAITIPERELEQANIILDLEN